MAYISQASIFHKCETFNWLYARCYVLLQEQYPSIYKSFVRGRGEFVDSLQEGVDKVLRDEESYFFVETKTGVSLNK